MDALNEYYPVYFVFGNHGPAPAQIEDYYLYLKQAFQFSGIELLLTEYPVPGKLNILIECFVQEYAYIVSETSKVKGTRFICLATEFITKQTFNDFSDPRRPKPSITIHHFKAFIRKTVDIFFPHSLRVFLIKRLPKLYFYYRDLFNKLFSEVHFSRRTAYGRYWQSRYSIFCEIVEQCEAIWCVSPHQMDAYQTKFGNKARLMPIGAWEAIANSEQGRIEKDIDFLFTGTITPHRKSIIDTLCQKGFKVVIGFPNWPAFIREHFTARSKICLHIRQHPTWKFPSIMRYHYLLCSGAVVVAEKAEESCEQEQFFTCVSPEDFVSACEVELAKGDFLRRGREAFEAYRQGSMDSQKRFLNLLQLRSSDGSLSQSQGTSYDCAVRTAWNDLKPRPQSVEF